ncbi:MAG TPA: hypothetical protein VM597_36385 [Gemmataceae bacterium]|nr:hypothetical protein [Gemmataceae bacterium]
MLTRLRAMPLPSRLLVLGFGVGVTVGAVLFEEIRVTHYWYSDGSREGFDVEAFGYTVRRTEVQGGTGVTTEELGWHGSAVVGPPAAAAVAALWPVSALSGRGRPPTGQADDYDDHRDTVA